MPDCFATWDMHEIPMWHSCDKVAWHTYVSYWCQMRPICESYTCPIWESNKCVTLLSDKWHIWDFPYDSYVARPYGTHMGHMGPRWVPCRKPICAAYANAICVSDRLCLAGCSLTFRKPVMNDCLTPANQAEKYLVVNFGKSFLQNPWSIPYGTNIYDTYKRHIRNMYVNICHTCSIYVDIYVNIYVLCEI